MTDDAEAATPTPPIWEDQVNLRFANLALLAANESYGNALRALRLVQELQSRVAERNGQAIDALDEAVGHFREVVAQFHLPLTPAQS